MARGTLTATLTGTRLGPLMLLLNQGLWTEDEVLVPRIILMIVKALSIVLVKVIRATAIVEGINVFSVVGGGIVTVEEDVGDWMVVQQGEFAKCGHSGNG